MGDEAAVAGGFSNRTTVVIALAVAVGLSLVVLKELSSGPAAAPAAQVPGVPHLAPPVPRAPVPPRAVRSLRPLSARAAAATPGVPGSFSGLVVDRVTGQGVPKASLTFQHLDGAWSATTDAAGHFELSPPEAGAWRLAEISADGYQPFRPEWGQSPVVLDAELGQRVEGLRFLLEPRVELIGQVEDDDGRPLDGAEVHAVNVPLGSEAGPWASADGGTFRFVAPEGALLVANLSGYRTARRAVDFKAEVSHRLTLTLVTLDGGAADGPAQTVSGTVVDETGVGLADALVTLEGREREWVEASATSGADGRFSLQVPGAGHWWVSAARAGYADDTVELGKGPLTLTLRGGGRISGRVADADGAPVPAFEVVVLQREGLARTQLSSTSVVNALGQYRLTGVKPGALSVLVLAAGQAPSAPVDLELKAGMEERADFKLSKGGEVDGTVVDRVTKQPIAGAVVTGEGNPNASLPVQMAFEARTGPDGRFHLAGFPERTRSLWCAASGHHARIVSGVTVKEGQTTQVTIALTPLKPGEEPQIELTGIGAVLKAVGDALVVQVVMPGGGAAEVGLQPGDAIVTVDGQQVTDFASGIEAIRGPEGTQVRLEVRRNGTLTVLDVPRRYISR